MSARAPLSRWYGTDREVEIRDWDGTDFDEICCKNVDVHGEVQHEGCILFLITKHDGRNYRLSIFVKERPWWKFWATPQLGYVYEDNY